MGVVHLARRPGGDRVALKVLRPHIVGDDEARRRLAREVCSLSRIRSRGSPRSSTPTRGATSRTSPPATCPACRCTTTSHEEGPIEGADLRWFAACLAEALAPVHAVGVLHRDIKPSNVLMEGRTPILIDFGLARVADDPKLTHTGWLLGTPGYLAPEILYGDDATTASDVHSWARHRRLRRHRPAALRARPVDGDHGPRPPRRARPHRPRARIRRAVDGRPRPRPAATVPRSTSCASWLATQSGPAAPRRRRSPSLRDDPFAAAAATDDGPGRALAEPTGAGGPRHLSPRAASATATRGLPATGSTEPRRRTTRVPRPAPHRGRPRAS